VLVLLIDPKKLPVKIEPRARDPYGPVGTLSWLEPGRYNEAAGPFPVGSEDIFMAETAAEGVGTVNALTVDAEEAILYKSDHSVVEVLSVTPVPYCP
jgi:hypothetical protein